MLCGPISSQILHILKGILILKYEGVKSKNIKRK